MYIFSNRVLELANHQKIISKQRIPRECVTLQPIFQQRLRNIECHSTIISQYQYRNIFKN